MELNPEVFLFLGCRGANPYGYATKTNVFCRGRLPSTSRLVIRKNGFISNKKTNKKTLVYTNKVLSQALLLWLF